MTDAAVVDGGPLVDPKASKREAAAAKKLTAAWKKQVKQLKAKDPDKKRDALRFCTQDARFFREQPEVLPVLLGLLARLKVGPSWRHFSSSIKENDLCTVRRLQNWCWTR